ncbi:ATP-dependent helicase [Elysia marginata]|uniref:ATP-dependent DNA helicase n=1 Tax=Elysia marginata TaxID=1093978 RepID=A0AAV4IYS6_9GAST|nr:ATP-dependent helicase [Elysia marginata]
MVVLPSSFTESPRYMHERTQDAMTYVRNYGRPDLFLTFTCNSKWEEITAELMPGQQSFDRRWKRRVQGRVVPGFPEIKKTDCLSRVYTVHPNNRECFYLRLLLHHVVGPASFQRLRTIQGHICNTYHEACNRLGLLENDAQWRDTMKEAASVQSPRQLRQLFSIILTSCELASPVLIWDELKERMSEDFLFQARRLASNPKLLFSNDIFNQSLIAIEDQVLAAANHNVNMYGLPQPTRETDPDFCREVLQEKGYNCKQLKTFIEENEPLLTPEQRDAYHHRGIIFLDAPGGTGKTFLINLLLAKIRQRREIALAVAPSVIAATLLPCERTAHSAFKLPLTMTKEEYPLCRVKKNSGTAKVLKR